MKNKRNKGFTLIEVIIYTALFSLLIGTAFVSAFQLIDGSGKLSAKTVTEAEGNFVLRKINWALTGVKTITTPSIGTAHNLVVTKYDNNQIDIQLVGTKIEIRESDNGNAFIPITTDNVEVSSLDFEYIPASGSGPAGIAATAIMNGTTFTITKYLRK
ncbi:MAG: hypothetical protein UU13_C0008G0004 [Candidatus Nomurabacteria bacterium GW2011_GWB1_40_7]|uniref:Type II secretion system protein n=1 Tax=Candidatus Nomurabacteria bacterium GW2011_GWB1_40_7 TaxID=1618744 RepID=A0A0G0SZS1_9BACT|nr:MAG: hypothetical protein UU13_C0008G0004 [Candidatus Nomurabacteria bacterium GW2011_GWB1_40_7]